MAYIQDHPLHPTANDPGSSRDGFDADVVVVGGGFAGLTAAAFAAREGAKVVVLERAAEVGGRASTRRSSDFLFNVGPHALYDDGPAARAFAELGVPYSGRRPAASGGLAFHGGTLHALPGGFVSLLTTDLLTLSGKLELGRVLGSLPKLRAASLEGQTLRQWLDATFRDDVVKGLVEALMRVTSYANDPDRACAAAAVAQLQAGLGKGVLYLDGGWATLAAGLRRAAEGAGAAVHPGSRVRSVTVSGAGVEVVFDPARAQGETRDLPMQDPVSAASPDAVFLDESAPPPDRSTKLRARVAVLAVPPQVAAALAGGDGADVLRAWSEELVPVKAACLDLGLRRLPDPHRLFVVGVDRPLYFSVHSASARLAPEGGALVHVAKYLGPSPADPKAVEAELEAFCDVVQPGWRGEVIERHYLPSMLVTGALVAAGSKRPGPAVPPAPNLLVAGDWVGDDAMIADAAVSSGRLAGRSAAVRAAAMRAADSIDAAVARAGEPRP